jgi:hypothetical protein
MRGAETWLKIVSFVLGAIVFVFTLGSWAKNVEDRELYAQSEIKALRADTEKLQYAFQEINQRLSRIEGKLDVTLRTLR